MQVIPSRSSRPISLPLAACITVLLLTLSGCNSMQSLLDFGSDDELDLQVPAHNLAVLGMDDFNVGKYFTAVEYFEEILDRYPFSPEATLAELKAADCKYYLERYLEALMLYTEFEERHPTNEAIPYVMFQKAMCNYQRIDRVDRDTTGAVQAIQLFKQLLRAYPASPYTAEAKARLKAAQEFLANHEYFVVEFYIRTAKFSQAETRLKYIMAMHPDAIIAPKAKELLARIEAGDPPRSNFAAWFPKMSLPDWSLFSAESAEESASGPIER